MDLVLGITILTVATYFISCIQQPGYPHFHKHRSFPGIHVHLYCLGPWVLDHCHALAIVSDIMA